MKLHRLALAVVPLLLLAPAALAQDAPAEPTITLLEAGAAPQAPLRYRPTKGAQFQCEMTMRTSMKQSLGPAMRTVMDVTIDDVAANGDIVFSARYTEAEAVNEPGLMPGLLEQVGAVLESVKGTTLRITVSDRGLPRGAKIELPEGVNPILGQQMEGMASSLEQIMTSFPSEAIGVGAKWKLQSKVKQNDMVISHTVVHTLTSQTGDTVELSSTIEQDAEGQDINSPMLPPGVTLRLTSLDGSGGGTTRMNLDQVMPLACQTKVTTDAKLSISVAGQVQEMTQQTESDIKISTVAK